MSLSLFGDNHMTPSLMLSYRNDLGNPSDIGAPMNDALKVACLALYLLAIVGAFGVLPAGITSILQKAALILLAAHVLELLFAFKNVRRYRGPLVDSIGLTLLFGLLHWKPLAKNS